MHEHLCLSHFRQILFCKGGCSMAFTTGEASKQGQAEVMYLCVCIQVNQWTLPRHLRSACSMTVQKHPTMVVTLQIAPAVGLINVNEDKSTFESQKFKK